MSAPVDNKGSLLGSVWNGIYGAVAEAVNVVWAYAPVRGAFGDVLVPEGPGARFGADVVDTLFGLVGLVAPPAKSVHQAVRGVGALADPTSLASTQLNVPVGGGVGLVEFDATAPGGDWGEPGREGAIASVYLDGEYHSDVIVIRERTGGYRVNLGWLQPGMHRIEIRRALRGTPLVRPVVTATRAEVLTGEQALIQRYAPILQLRDLRAPGGRLESSYSDAPMVIAPSIQRHEDGSRTITYFVMFSNEDGGTSMPDLIRGTSRGSDYEPIIQIRVDKFGRRIGQPQYQGPVHRTYTFGGVWAGDRPVLRVATPNNNFSSRVRKGSPLWSQAVESVNLLRRSNHGRPSKNSLDNGVTSGTDTWLMYRFPWTYAVMGKELLREGRTLGPAVGADLRRMMVLSPSPDAARRKLEHGGSLVVRTKSGRSARVSLGSASSQANRGAAIPLPGGIRGSEVASITGARGRVRVLDESFMLHTITTRPTPAHHRTRRRVRHSH